MTVTITLPESLFVPCSKDKSELPQGVTLELSKFPQDILVRLFEHGAAAKLNDAHSAYTKKDNPSFSVAGAVAFMAKSADAMRAGQWATRGSGAAAEPVDPLADMIETVAKEWTYRDYGQGKVYKGTKDKPTTGTYRATPSQMSKLEELANRKGWFHASSLEKAECLERIIAGRLTQEPVIREAKRRLATADKLDELLTD